MLTPVITMFAIIVAIAYLNNMRSEIYISKDRTVSHCIRHWPRDGMSGISPLNGLKIEL